MSRSSASADSACSLEARSAASASRLAMALSRNTSTARAISPISSRASRSRDAAVVIAAHDRHPSSWRSSPSGMLMLRETARPMPMTRNRNSSATIATLAFTARKRAVEASPGRRARAPAIVVDELRGHRPHGGGVAVDGLAQEALLGGEMLGQKAEAAADRERAVAQRRQGVALQVGARRDRS